MRSGHPFREEDWRKAQERVLAYLQYLNLPSPANLELALEALKRAKDRLEDSPDTHPITESWRVLKALLAQQTLPAAPGSVSAGDEFFSLAGIPGRCGEVLSMPPLNRCSMVPGRIR